MKKINNQHSASEKILISVTNKYCHQIYVKHFGNVNTIFEDPFFGAIYDNCYNVYSNGFEKLVECIPLFYLYEIMFLQSDKKREIPALLEKCKIFYK